jgi:hypothetical protein
MANHKQELPMAVISVAPSDRNMELLYRISDSPIHHSYKEQFIVHHNSRGDLFFYFQTFRIRIAHGNHVFDQTE